MEKWVKGYEGLYSVTDDGIVYSHNYRRSGKKADLLHCIQAGGMHTLYLSHNGVRKQCVVARLVAEAFIPNPNNLPCVCFLDGNNDNIVVSNLQWCNRDLPVKLSYERKRARGADNELRKDGKRN